MASLLDTIKQNNPALQTAGVTDETSKLQNLMRAKSGKAVDAPGVAASNLGEQTAVAQTNNTMQNTIAPAAAIQNQGMEQQQAAQQQQTEQQVSDINQGRRFDTIQNKLKTSQLLDDLDRNKGQIDQDRSKAQMEQVATSLRLQNTKYINDLQREGNLRRLTDATSFNEELARNTLGANQDLLEKQLGNQSVLTANDRAFKEAMARLDINTAYDMFKNDLSGQKERALYSGAGALATAGIGAIGQMKSASPTQTAQAENANPTSDVNTMKDMKGY